MLRADVLGVGVMRTRVKSVWVIPQPVAVRARRCPERGPLGKLNGLQPPVSATAQNWTDKPGDERIHEEPQVLVATSPSRGCRLSNHCSRMSQRRGLSARTTNRSAN